MTVGTSWGMAGDTPISDISAIKRRVQRDCGFPIARAYMNEPTMTKFVELPEVSGGYVNDIALGTANATKQGQLTEEQKRTFQNERMIPRFHGIDWIEYDNGYLAAGIGSTYTPYIPDDMIIFMVDGGQNSFKLQYGPSLDHAAPPNWTGVFTKSEEKFDPSVREVLFEVQYMPILLNPFKIATLDITA